LSTRIAWDPEDDVACLYDSVTGVAFGEVFSGDESYEQAERFLEWLAAKELDARGVQGNTLRDLRREFAEMNERKPETIPVRRDAA
jgi:hypothetical protein